MLVALCLLFISFPVIAEYKSQAGQDSFVNEHFFHNKKDGCFVDVGAHDGQSFSNSWFFEKDLGWHGICVEPLPHLFEQLQKERNCICINACASDSSGSVPFLHVNSCDEMLSGPCATFNQNKLNAVIKDVDIFGGELNIIQVPCVRLDKIFKEHGITHIDFLSIDVEGHELQVLVGIDFSKVIVDVIAIENDYHDEHLRALLQKHGFKLYAHVHVDDIFVRDGFVQ